MKSVSETLVPFEFGIFFSQKVFYCKFIFNTSPNRLITTNCNILIRILATSTHNWHYIHSSTKQCDPHIFNRSIETTEILSCCKCRFAEIDAWWIWVFKRQKGHAINVLIVSQAKDWFIRDEPIRRSQIQQIHRKLTKRNTKLLEDGKSINFADECWRKSKCDQQYAWTFWHQV